MEWQCLRCGEGIAPSDPHAVRISVQNLWDATAEQGFAAHAECAKQALTGSEPFDPVALAD